MDDDILPLKLILRKKQIQKSYKYINRYPPVMIEDNIDNDLIYLFEYKSYINIRIGVLST